MEAIVGVNDGCDSVDGRRDAVVILVPDGNDGITALAPSRGGMDRSHDPLYSLVAKSHQCRIQANLGAVVIRIELAELSAVAATVLVIALVGDDERVVRRFTRGQVAIEAGRSIKRNHIGQAVLWVGSSLSGPEIGERIVLYRVKGNDLPGVEGGRVCRLQIIEQRKVSEVGKVAVAVIDTVSARQREAFLISLPGLSGCDQLIGDADTQDIGI